MDVTQVLHMNGGMGETSYANNSSLQKRVLSLAEPIIEEAIASLYCSNTIPRSLAVADLGCSFGPNTLFVVFEVIKVVEKLCRELNHQSPEYQIFLNDLPQNDFNNIFKSLGSFKEKLSKEMVTGFGPCYFNGVPASFYGRIFPTKTLHFVHSSSSLHFLSQVPEGVEKNKGNICLGVRSPSDVQKSYYQQFQRDFSLFLKCRAEELVEGGRMVLAFLGKRSNDPSSNECLYIYEVLAQALNDMVLEGIIKEERMDSFNIPLYTPSPSEVKLEVLKEGSFNINHLELFELNWNTSEDSKFSLSETLEYKLAMCTRAVTESMLASHFGEAIIEDVFRRHQEILAHHMSEDKTFTIVNMSLTRTA